MNNLLNDQTLGLNDVINNINNNLIKKYPSWYSYGNQAIANFNTSAFQNKSVTVSNINYSSIINNLNLKDPKFKNLKGLTFIFPVSFTVKFGNLISTPQIINFSINIVNDLPTAMLLSSLITNSISKGMSNWLVSSPSSYISSTNNIVTLDISNKNDNPFIQTYNNFDVIYAKYKNSNSGLNQDQGTQLTIDLLDDYATYVLNISSSSSDRESVQINSILKSEGITKNTDVFGFNSLDQTKGNFDDISNFVSPFSPLAKSEYTNYNQNLEYLNTKEYGMLSKNFYDNRIGSAFNEASLNNYFNKYLSPANSGSNINGNVTLGKTNFSLRNIEFSGVSLGGAGDTQVYLQDPTSTQGTNLEIDITFDSASYGTQISNFSTIMTDFLNYINYSWDSTNQTFVWIIPNDVSFDWGNSPGLYFQNIIHPIIKQFKADNSNLTGISNFDASACIMYNSHKTLVPNAYDGGPNLFFLITNDSDFSKGLYNIGNNPVTHNWGTGLGEILNLNFCFGSNSKDAINNTYSEFNITSVFNFQLNVNKLNPSSNFSFNINKVN